MCAKIKFVITEYPFCQVCILTEDGDKESVQKFVRSLSSTTDIEKKEKIYPKGTYFQKKMSGWEPCG